MQVEKYWLSDWQRVLQEEISALTELCSKAAQHCLLAGFNSNASLRLPQDLCLITRAGVGKEALKPDDFSLLNISESPLGAEAARLAGAAPSTESAMHLEIFRKQPEAKAILHCHPPHLLALALRLPGLKMPERLAMPLFEAEAMRARLGHSPALHPGTPELAETVGNVACLYEAVWLEGHGLAVWSDSPLKALALAEELEHLAKVRLLAGF